MEREARDNPTAPAAPAHPPRGSAGAQAPAARALLDAAAPVVDRVRRVDPGPLLDPGWLFLIVGLAALGAGVLIPAHRDADATQRLLRQARDAEAHRTQRLDRYSQFRESLDRGDPATIQALAAMQLNQAPPGSQLLLTSGDVADRSASVFSGLEPPPLAPPPPPPPMSRLERWATDPVTRWWLLGGGGLCVLIGLLPMRRATPPGTPPTPPAPPVKDQT